VRLLRKAVHVFRTEGVLQVLWLVVRKVLHVLRIRRVKGYPYRHFETISGLDPYQPETIPAPRLTWAMEPAMRLRWYVPEPGRGSGGHHTLLRLIQLLERKGHRSELAVLDGGHTGKSRSEMRAFVREHFGVDVRVVWDTDDLEDVDVVLASSWHSAYTVARDTRCAVRAYVVQDWEPDFYARGSEQIMAENSYLLGHAHITAGPWLAERLRRLGLLAEHFYLGADQEVYYPSEEARNPGRPHVVFYARPFTERRCFELGVEALRILDRELGPGRLLVSMVGSDIDTFPTGFDARWLGIVPPAELRRLYAGAGAVLVLSATNPSLVPLEAALCEAPVVDLRLPSAAGTFEDGITARLVPPSAGSIASALAELLADPASGRALGRRAREHALRFTWEAAAEQVERHLLDALRRTAAAAVAEVAG
jgi:glycosyltransferase involved in cell wall biosynthesis